MCNKHLHQVKMIQNILDMKAVTSAGPFLYVVLQEGTTNTQVSRFRIRPRKIDKILCRPNTVTLLEISNDQDRCGLEIIGNNFDNSFDNSFDNYFDTSFTIFLTLI